MVVSQGALFAVQYPTISLRSREQAMGKSNQHAPKSISRAELAGVGLVRIARNPLVVQCLRCGVEWRPVRRPGVRWWLCHNGCNTSASS